MKLLVCILLVFTTIACHTNQTAINEIIEADVTPKKTEYKIPNVWRTPFLERIKERVSFTNLEMLENTPISNSDIELRVWVGFDITLLRGVVLRKGAQNFAFYLPQYSPSRNDNTELIVKLSEPKSGWENLWKRLEEQNIMTLPDSADAGIDSDISEGAHIVVEIKTSQSFRNYRYPTQLKPSRVEIEQAMNICQILSKEFDIRML